MYEVYNLSVEWDSEIKKWNFQRRKNWTKLKVLIHVVHVLINHNMSYFVILACIRQGSANSYIYLVLKTCHTSVYDKAGGGIILLKKLNFGKERV